LSQQNACPAGAAGDDEAGEAHAVKAIANAGRIAFMSPSVGPIREHVNQAPLANGGVEKVAKWKKMLFVGIKPEFGK
jgi:hypothetical protein